MQTLVEVVLEERKKKNNLKSIEANISAPAKRMKCDPLGRPARKFFNTTQRSSSLFSLSDLNLNDIFVCFPVSLLKKDNVLNIFEIA